VKKKDSLFSLCLPCFVSLRFCCCCYPDFFSEGGGGGYYLQFIIIVIVSSGLRERKKERERESVFFSSCLRTLGSFFFVFFCLSSPFARSLALSLSGWSSPFAGEPLHEDLFVSVEENEESLRRGSRARKRRRRRRSWSVSAAAATVDVSVAVYAVPTVPSLLPLLQGQRRRRDRD